MKYFTIQTSSVSNIISMKAFHYISQTHLSILPKSEVTWQKMTLVSQGICNVKLLQKIIFFSAISIKYVVTESKFTILVHL